MLENPWEVLPKGFETGFGASIHASRSWRGTSLPCKPSGRMKLHGQTSLATKAWHPPRLSTHHPASELAPTVQRKREGAGGRLGEAPGCCQAFPFKARARSGYSLFPPALTTNPLPSSSLPGPGAHIPSGTAPGRWGRQPGHGMPAPRGDRSVT